MHIHLVRHWHGTNLLNQLLDAFKAFKVITFSFRTGISKIISGWSLVIWVELINRNRQANWFTDLLWSRINFGTSTKSSVSIVNNSNIWPRINIKFLNVSPYPKSYENWTEIFLRFGKYSKFANRLTSMSFVSMTSIWM